MHMRCHGAASMRGHGAFILFTTSLDHLSVLGNATQATWSAANTSQTPAHPPIADSYSTCSHAPWLKLCTRHLPHHTRTGAQAACTPPAQVLTRHFCCVLRDHNRAIQVRQRPPVVKVNLHDRNIVIIGVSQTQSTHGQCGHGHEARHVDCGSFSWDPSIQRVKCLKRSDIQRQGTGQGGCEAALVGKALLGNAMAGKCCVCSSRDVDEGNVILKCTQCYMLVHQACYGVETVPGEHLMPNSPAQHTCHSNDRCALSTCGVCSRALTD
jgi:hypothetical protein